MHYYKKNYLFVFISIFLLGCTANKNSFYKKGEVVAIKLNKSQLANQQNSIAFSTITPFLVDLGIGQVKQLLDKEAGKFTAMYQAEISDSNFYTKEKSMNYDSFSIERKADVNGVQETVALIEFKLNTDASRTFISLKPINLKIDKSKAKLRQNDTNLDIKVDIRMVSFWIDADQEYRTAETANTSLLLSNIELGQSYNSSNKELSRTSGWLFPVPLSTKPDGTTFGRGTFNLYCTITEIDDYGERIKTIKNTFETNEVEIRNLLLNSLNE